MCSSDLLQERKGKKRKVDILHLIERMNVKEGGNEMASHVGFGVELVLRNVGGRTAKPLEIVGAILGLEGEALSRCKVIKME